MKIIDLANLVAPEAKKEIIGIRPGEKLHETLITNEESSHTKEHDDYYTIEPDFPFWPYSEDRGGKKLLEDFVYSSDTNTQWLKEEDLKRIIE